MIKTWTKYTAINNNYIIRKKRDYLHPTKIYFSFINVKLANYYRASFSK